MLGIRGRQKNHDPTLEVGHPRWSEGLEQARVASSGSTKLIGNYYRDNTSVRFLVGSYEVPWQLTLGRKIASSARVETQNSTDWIRHELRLIWAILDQRLTGPAEQESFETTRSDSDLSNHAQPDNRVSTMTLWLLQDRWINHGVQLALTTVERTFFTSMTLAIKIPVPTVTGKSTFIADLAVRPPNITCHLAIRKRIPMSSDIVKACESQDLATVRHLLLRHKFGPNDMTEDCRPLLWVSPLQPLELPKPPVISVNPANFSGLIPEVAR
jgi:hypothetical protein